MRRHNWNLPDSHGSSPQGANAGASRQKDRSYSSIGSKGGFQYGKGRKESIERSKS